MRLFRTALIHTWQMRRVAAAAVAMVASIFTPSITQTAVANGDTRTISLYHAHTNETITATFRVNGSYDSAVLEKLNWFLRDWRMDQPTKMDPRLFDLVWETYRESGSREPIKVMSAYRSPQTNAMLRRRSRAVAEFSQHILGKAMDQHYTDVSMARVREIGMRLQRGGVGYYPTAGSPFVHLDVGSIRHWPKMSYDQLARIFPDGRTVHIPSNGQPLPGYELARAQIEASGANNVPISSIGKTPSFFAALFGGGGDEDDGGAAVLAGRGRKQFASAGSRNNIQVATLSNDSANSNNFFLQEARNSAAPAADTAPSSNSRLSRRGAKPVPAVEAPVVQVAAVKPAPEPEIILPPARPQIAAAPVEAPRPVPAPVAEEAKVVASAENIPLPPRRPNALLASLVAINVPLPPVRPAEIGALTASQSKPDPLARLIVASNRDAALTVGTAALPDVILHGTEPVAKPTPIPALGYAATGEATPAVARPVIVPRAPVVASMVQIAPIRPVPSAPKVDRAGLRNLTNAELTERDPHQSAIGAAAPPLRRAGSMKAQIAALFADPVAGATTRFDVAATSLPTDRFLPQ